MADSIPSLYCLCVHPVNGPHKRWELIWSSPLFCQNGFQNILQGSTIIWTRKQNAKHMCLFRNQHWHLLRDRTKIKIWNVTTEFPSLSETTLSDKIWHWCLLLTEEQFPVTIIDSSWQCVIQCQNQALGSIWRELSAVLGNQHQRENQG